MLFQNFPLKWPRIVILLQQIHKALGVVSPVSASIGQCNPDNINDYWTEKVVPFRQPFANLTSKSKLSIGVCLVVLHVLEIDEMMRVMEMDTKLQLVWSDPAYAYNCALTPGSRSVVMKVPTKFNSPKPWLPTIAFDDSVGSFRSTFEQRPTSIHVTPTGQFEMTERVRTQQRVVVDLQKYPFDEIKLQVTPSIVGDNSDQIDLVWLSGCDPLPAGVISHKAMGTFELYSMQKISDPRRFQCDSNPEVKLDAVFHRRYLSFIFRVYIPNMIIITIAWCTFFMHPRSNTPRAPVLASLLVAGSVQFSRTVATVPQVGYLKGIDIWNIGCMGFLLFAIAECSVVMCLLRSPKKFDGVFDKIDGIAAVVYVISVVVFNAIYIFTLVI